MKRIFALVLALTVCLFSAAALAEGKLTVTEKNLLEFEDSDTAYFFAKVENTGDDAIGVGSGKLVAFSADDEVLVSENYVSACPDSAILQPEGRGEEKDGADGPEAARLQPGEALEGNEVSGETARESSDIADYKFSMESDDYGAPLNFIPCSATIEVNGEYDSYVYVTLANDTEEVQYGLYITVALHDAEGALIFVKGQSADYVGVHPGSTVTIRVYIDSEFIEYYTNTGIEPATVDAYVCYEAE